MTIITMGGADLTAQAHRNQTSLHLLPGLSPLETVDGVQSGMNLIKTSGMNFTIGAGRAAINGTTYAEGTFATAITSNHPGSFEPGDATRNRIDLVVLQTYPDAAAESATQLEVIKGAYPSTGLPVEPAVPAGSLPLWSVPINAGMSAGNGGFNRALAKDKRPNIGMSRFASFTPTWNGLGSLGSGFKSTGRWRRDGDTVYMEAKLVAGSGASVLRTSTSFITVNLPVTRLDNDFRSFGRGVWVHPPSGGLYYDLTVINTSNTTAAIHGIDSAGALRPPGYLNYPFAATSEINIALEYSIDPEFLG